MTAQRVRGKIGPLMRREFRSMKWLLMLNLLIAAGYAYSLFSSFRGAGSVLWHTQPVSSLYEKSLGSILQMDYFNYLFFSCAAAAVMALLQQFIAYNAKNALIMASLPYTRGRQLKAQLLIGGLCYTAPILLFGTASLIFYGAFHAELTMIAQISPYPAFMLADLTPLMIVVPILRIWLLVTFAYVFSALIGHLFANPFMTLGFVAGGLMLYFAGISMARDVVSMYEHVHQIKRSTDGLRGLYDMGRLVLDTGLYPHAFNSIVGLKTMPWETLPLVVGIFCPAIALCVIGCYFMRRNLHIERLGGAFLSPVSRYAVIGLATAFALLVPFYFYSTYDYDLRQTVYNPYFPALFLFPATVFFIGWLVLVRRPQKKRLSKARMGALALAVCLCLTGTGQTARAEMETYWSAEKIARVAQFDPSRLQFDRDAAQRAHDLMAAIDEKLTKASQPGGESANSEDEWADDWMYWGEAHAEFLKKLLNKTAVNGEIGYLEQQDLDERFSESLLHMDMLQPERQARMLDALRGQNYPLFADALETFLQEAQLNDRQYLYENGVWMQLECYNYEDWDQVYFAAHNIALYVSTPSSLIGYESIHEALEAGNRMRRCWVFSNGDWDTMAYQLMDMDATDQRYSSYGALKVFAQNGELRQLRLSLPNRMNAQTVLTTIENTLVAAGIDAAVAQSTVLEILDAVENHKVMSGGEGPITWQRTTPYSSESYISIDIA